VLCRRLAGEEGDNEQAAADQEPGDDAGIQPIEPVALVEPGIDQSACGTAPIIAGG
jgi:hypothetical protein